MGAQQRFQHVGSLVTPQIVLTPDPGVHQRAAGPPYEQRDTMAYDEGVAERCREYLTDCAGISEKKMFGGLAFMYRGNMLMGIVGEVLMARVGLKEYDAALKHPFVRKMDFTGRPMKGYVYVDSAGFEADADLKRWVELCLRFNASLPSK